MLIIDECCIYMWFEISYKNDMFQASKVLTYSEHQTSISS